MVQFFLDRKPRFLHDVFFYKYYLGWNKNSIFHKHKLIEISIPFEVQNDWKPDRPNQLKKRHEQLKVSQFQVNLSVLTWFNKASRWIKQRSVFRDPWIKALTITCGWIIRSLSISAGPPCPSWPEAWPAFLVWLRSSAFSSTSSHRAFSDSTTWPSKQGRTQSTSSTSSKSSPPLSWRICKFEDWRYFNVLFHFIFILTWSVWVRNESLIFQNL